VLVDFRSSGKLRGDKPVYASRLSATSPLRQTSMAIGPLLAHIGRRKGLNVNFQRLARRGHDHHAVLDAARPITGIETEYLKGAGHGYS